MRFEPAPEYQVFPTRERPLKPYEAAVRAARETQPLIRELDPDVVVADILTIAAGARGRAGGAAVGDARAPRPAGRPSPGFPPYSIGARLPRTPVGARAVAGARPARPAAGPSAAGRELNETRRRLGLPPLDHVHGGISRELALVATFPQLEYPRHVVVAVGARDRAADVRAAGGRRRAAARRRPARARRAQHVAGPRRSGCCARRSPGWPTSPCACSRRRTCAATRSATVPVPRERARRRLALLHAHDAPLRGGRLPRGPRDRRPRAGERSAAGRPARPRATWPRTRRAWRGRAPASRCPRRLVTERGIRLAVRRVLGDPSYAKRARELADWASATTARSCAADGPGGKAPGVGLEPTTLRLTAESLCQLSYPGSIAPEPGPESVKGSRNQPPSTSAWQFAHSSTHFRASRRIAVRERVIPRAASVNAFSSGST